MTGSLEVRVRARVAARAVDVLVFGGTLVEQVVRIPRVPGPHQDNVTLDEMCTLPGGSGANVAVYVARLGCRGRLLDKWGDDEYADFLQNSLQEENVDLTLCRRIPGVRSAFMIILTLPDGDWTGIIRSPAELALQTEDVSKEVIDSSVFLHFHGFCMGTPESRAGVQKATQLAHEVGVLVSMDASTPVALRQPSVLRHFFSRCDVVFSNRIEAQAITGQDTVPGAAQELLGLGPTLAVIKAGADGCYVANRASIEHVPALAIEVVDTIGAGDGLVAGTLSGLAQGRPLKDAVRLGVATAALVCQGMGAQSRRFRLEDALCLSGLPA